ncbi:insulinase family protein [Gemmobacter straminiformis]|uniref:Insulinase family protein n=2 Tax=Paragemmobacter straminiformis TaxID=2045119 RepID=A0A842I9Z4_9RHOB|nr:pitrilysin family protein [Gemmobacter straminiformis]MBC2836177.1 insulinase family protein [Gemmobacter straminiformis]
MSMMRFAAGLALAVTLALPARAAVDIQEVTSPGGLTAWLVEDHNIPFTALEVRFRGGSSVEDPLKRGAVNLMTALIEEGTGDMDSLAFAEARDDLAASFSFSSDQDSVGVSAQFLTENRDKAVDLLRQAITAPRFDADAIERVRGQVLSNLRASEKDPGDMAGKAFNAQAFGDHPYATSGDGTVESVTALTRDDLVAAHQATLARDRIYIAAAGDISAEDLGKLVDTLFGALPATGAPLPARAPFDLTGGTTVIDYPGPQSVVLWGEQGIKRDDPDFFAASILNEIMGGSRFSARLMTEVREKRGLTYGIGTSLAAYDQAELLAGQSQIPNAKVKDAVDVIKAEWAKMSEQGITAEELAATKTYLTGAYPLRFDGNGPLATIMVNMQLIGLPSDYPKTRNDKVNAVTLEDANRVAKSLFRPENLRFVIVGQPEGVTSTD